MSNVLIFDCDGVLGDTELYGHLPAFNQMWAELGVPWQWSAKEYARKQKIGGGKERMASLFGEAAFLQKFSPPAGVSERNQLLARWHDRKTAIYKGLISQGRIPSRSGVKRLAEAALNCGWTLAVASTSARESVEAMLCHAVGRATAARFSLVLAGDVVRAKKPAPDIYLLAADRLGVSPANCVAIEDSNNGVAAAVAAGMKCVVTATEGTLGEDFSDAEIVLTCLGDPGGEICQVLANRSKSRPGRYFTTDDLETVLGTPQAICANYSGGHGLGPIRTPTRWAPDLRP
jgi:beta-phosphoglucomutase-like phosphatase (HAD superfamily)